MHSGQPEAKTTPAASARPGRVSVIARIKWAMIVLLALVEIGFDFWIEPWLRVATAWEEFVERYMAVVEAVAMGSIIYVVFSQIERLEHQLALRQQELGRLYEAASRWDEQLEALHRASVDIAREGTYQQLLGRIAALAAELSGATYSALAEFDEAQRVVSFVTYGVSEGVQEAIGRPPDHRGLLARLSGTQPVRIDDVTHAAGYTGFPAGHPQFRAFLGVPIRWEGELLGHLYLGGQEDRAAFSPSDERLLQMFAVQAAIIIVRERVARAYAGQVRRSERHEIEVELHDRALQGLYALGIQLQRAKGHGLAALTDTMSVDLAIEAVQRSMVAIRDVLDALERDAPGSAAEALRAEAEGVARLYGMTVLWRCVELAERLPEHWIPKLAQVVHEAVANAGRHGQAQQVQVELSIVDGVFSLGVEDDGTGFSAQEVKEGHGMVNVRRSALDLSGTATLSCSRSGGARLELRLPFPTA